MSRRISIRSAPSGPSRSSPPARRVAAAGMVMRSSSSPKSPPSPTCGLMPNRPIFGRAIPDDRKRARRRLGHLTDEIGRNPQERVLQPLVQRHVNDAQAAADEHEKDFRFGNVHQPRD